MYIPHQNLGTLTIEYSPIVTIWRNRDAGFVTLAVTDDFGNAVVYPDLHLVARAISDFA